MFDLFWVPNLIKIGHIAILRPTDILTILRQPGGVFIIESRSGIANIIFMINGLDLCWVPNLIALEYISFLGPNFSGIRGLIVALMSNVCYLNVILIFLIVTWWLLVVYCSLLVVTACYRSLQLVPNFSMNAKTALFNDLHICFSFCIII